MKIELKKFILNEGENKEKVYTLPINTQLSIVCKVIPTNLEIDFQAYILKNEVKSKVIYKKRLIINNGIENLNFLEKFLYNKCYFELENAVNNELKENMFELETYSKITMKDISYTEIEDFLIKDYMNTMYYKYELPSFILLGYIYIDDTNDRKHFKILKVEKGYENDTIPYGLITCENSIYDNKVELLYDESFYSFIYDKDLLSKEIDKKVYEIIEDNCIDLCMEKCYKNFEKAFITVLENEILR